MDEDKKSSKNDSMSNSQCELPPTMKKFSAETNLLGDDEDDFNLNL